MLSLRIRHHTFTTHPALVICFVLDSCTGFIFCVVESSLFIMPYESEVELLASISLLISPQNKNNTTMRT